MEWMVFAYVYFVYKHVILFKTRIRHCKRYMKYYITFKSGKILIIMDHARFNLNIRLYYFITVVKLKRDMNY